MNFHLSHIRIDRKALLHNYHVFSNLLEKSFVMPIIKSNAYGHGLLEVSEILSEKKIPFYGVNSITEVLELLPKVKNSLFLIMGNNGLEIPQLESYHLEPTSLSRLHFALSSLEGLKILEASPLKKYISFHLEIDTGLSRLGTHSQAMEACLLYIKENLSSNFKGVFTHFANVEDIIEQDYALLQIQNFQNNLNIVRSYFPSHQLTIHSAASAATLLLKQTHFDMVRMGISLYGLWASRQTHLSFMSHNSRVEKEKTLELKPVLSWISTLVHIHTITKGTFVGYGCTFRAEQDMCIGIVPVGYYEGYDRHLSNQSYILVYGQRARVLGRVSMNMICVDLTQIKEAKVGMPVTLIGQEGNEKISVEQLAEWIGTVNYEVVSRIHPSIKRVVVDK